MHCEIDRVLNSNRIKAMKFYSFVCLFFAFKFIELKKEHFFLMQLLLEKSFVSDIKVRENFVELAPTMF